MRIGFSELRALTGNPTEWARARLRQTGSPRWSYVQATRAGIYRLHKVSDLAESRRYLSSLMDGVHLTNNDRRAQADENLLRYSEWNDRAQPLVVKVRLNTRLQINADDFVSGELGRLDLDVDSSGYKAVALGLDLNDLAIDVRMPLMQRAVAELLGVDDSSVAVGVQQLDGSAFVSRSFSARRINAAINDVKTAIAEAGRELTR